MNSSSIELDMGMKTHLENSKNPREIFTAEPGYVLESTSTINPINPINPINLISPISLHQFRESHSIKPKTYIRSRKPSYSALYNSIQDLEMERTSYKSPSLNPIPSPIPSPVPSPVPNPSPNPSSIPNQVIEHRSIPLVDFNEIRSIFMGLSQDQVVQTKEIRLKDNKYIIIPMTGYTILIEHHKFFRSYISISLVDRENKYMEINELGFDPVIRTCYSYEQLNKIIKEVILSNYNSECYYQIKKVGQELEDIGHKVDMKWGTFVMIETSNVELEVEISYPPFIKGNRGIVHGDPAKPQVIKAVYRNLNAETIKIVNTKIRFRQKTKTYKTTRDLFLDLEMYKML